METPKAPARPRAKKPTAKAAAAAAAVLAEEPALALPKPKAAKPKTGAKAAPAAAPAPAAEKPRKARAAKKAVAEPQEVPAVEAAPAPEAAPQPIVAAGDLLTPQAQAVLVAIQEGRAVELLFLDADTNPPRTFEPRQLIFDTFAKGWYVWGWDRRYNAERHHLLSLLSQVNLVDGLGRAAQGPYKEGTPANLIGGWLGGEPIRVKAVLLKQWIFAVRQAPAPFPEFKIEDLEEGKAQVSFTATDLRAITRWVMQFGDGVQILEPQRLLDRIKQVGLTWGGKPAQAAPAAPAAQSAPAAPAPKSQPRQERRPEHREHRSEHRSEQKSEPYSERKAPEQPRHSRENRESHEAPKAKPAKVEIRIDRL